MPVGHAPPASRSSSQTGEFSDGTSGEDTIGTDTWRSLEAVEWATLEWVDWYNHRRLLEPLGHVPPAEAEARYYDNLEDTALAA